MIALDRLTGALRWDVYMPDEPQHYGSTRGAAGGRRPGIGGVSGADDGIRGFLAAYKASTGQLAWRHWTVPSKGEPGWDTWRGGAVEFGGGSTWLTGSYDPESKVLYWAVGNPYPDTDGKRSPGRQPVHQLHFGARPPNRKAALVFSIHAARPARLGTPSSLCSWSMPLAGPPAEAAPARRPQRFFYVLDRTNGELLLAKAFAQKISWASGIDAKGRPIRVARQYPHARGNAHLPGYPRRGQLDGNRNNPATGLFYVMTIVENCGV